MRDFWKDQRELDKERRELITKLMEPHEEYFRQKYKEIRDTCGISIGGHSFRFTDFGPLGHAWYHCSKCGASRLEGFDE